MKQLLPMGALGLAGLVGAGLLVIPATTAASAADQDAFTNREDSSTELVLVADDDDDDDNTGNADTRDAADSANTRHSGLSRATNDNTRSNFTEVSRDRDLSRGDKTRDWTKDGGDHTRDLTPNLTNDGSRNDTRGRG